jgi:hypothetical protein
MSFVSFVAWRSPSSGAIRSSRCWGGTARRGHGKVGRPRGRPSVRDLRRRVRPGPDGPARARSPVRLGTPARGRNCRDHVAGRFGSRRRRRADSVARSTGDAALRGDGGTTPLRKRGRLRARADERVGDIRRSSGAFHDNPTARVSLVSTTSVRSWDPRPFRANVLLDGEGEDSLVGSRVTLGEAMLDIEMRIERCVMTTRAQAGGVESDLDVLRTLARERDACLAVGALVVAQGTVRVGDSLVAT